MPGATPIPVTRNMRHPRRSPVRRARKGRRPRHLRRARRRVIVMEVPRAAASSSRPMMLLPSMVRPARSTSTCAPNVPASRTNRAAARACRPRLLPIVTARLVTPALQAGAARAGAARPRPSRARCASDRRRPRSRSGRSRGSVAPRAAGSVAWRSPASFISIGRFTPVITSTCCAARNGRPRLAGVPPNMSVSTMTPAGRATRVIAAAIASRAVSTSSCQPIETATKPESSPTIISAALTSSVASCPCVTTTTPTSGPRGMSTTVGGSSGGDQALATSR